MPEVKKPDSASVEVEPERIAKTGPAVNGAQQDARRTAKICEYLPYSGREAFKKLRANTLIALSDRKKKEKQGYVIGVTSAQVSEGKSTTALNLAYSLAELGNTVMLIDCDMRRPAIHANVGASLTPGLSDVLLGKENLNKVAVSYKSSADTTSFAIIPGGEIADHPSELLNSNRFQKLIEVVASAYDYVILDLPPVGPVIDAVMVSKCTDGLLLVIRENHCPRYVLDDCLEQLRYAKANMLGFVLNGCVEGAGKRYQYGKKYDYRYDRYQYGK